MNILKRKYFKTINISISQLNEPLILNVKCEICGACGGMTCQVSNSDQTLTDRLTVFYIHHHAGKNWRKNKSE